MAIYLFGYMISFLLAIFAWTILIGGFLGPPMVATPKKVILEALSEISPKMGDFMIDLGSGTGRVLRIANLKHKVKGLGYEINPFLVLWSRLRVMLSGIKEVKFKNKNYLKEDLSKADIIFMYLMPKFLPAIAGKLEKECKKGTIIISQRFAIEKWNKSLVKEILRQKNSTFIYRL